MRIGVYGGSFDPVHCGHITPVIEAQRSLQLDRVVYLPTATPPHKSGRTMAPPHARFAMVELALLDHPDLVVSPFELTLERPAYTVDSVRHFSFVYPQAELFLIIGGDAFSSLDTWDRWLELIESSAFAILVRKGWEMARVKEGLHPALAELLQNGRAVPVENDPVNVSSTEMRRLLARDELISPELMPALVVRYAKKYSLYS